MLAASYNQSMLWFFFVVLHNFRSHIRHVPLLLVRVDDDDPAPPPADVVPVEDAPPPHQDGLGGGAPGEGQRAEAVLAPQVVPPAAAAWKRNKCIFS